MNLKQAVPAEPTVEDLDAALKAAMDDLYVKFPGAALVAMGSLERGFHSNPVAYWRGRCLPVLGLIDVGSQLIRRYMPGTYQRT